MSAVAVNFIIKLTEHNCSLGLLVINGETNGLCLKYGIIMGKVEKHD